ncbi:MAG: Lrp/AsnC family transcriptional regulator [Chloroflexota bacterium]|nr:Lrp/AsnC family transcriptional regulator [Chloroflexota bacterium]
MNEIRDILKILEKDGRATASQIATMTGKDVKEVERAIRQAEKSRAIVKYKAVVNWEKAGVESVWALIEVRVAPQREVGFDAIAERIYRFPEVRSLYLVSGTYDLSVQVVGSTMQEVSAFVARKLAPLEGVQATVTHFLMKRYKEDGEVLDGREEKVKRLPIHP